MGHSPHRISVVFITLIFCILSLTSTADDRNNFPEQKVSAKIKAPGNFLRTLENIAKNCNTSKEALKIYEEFLKRYELSAKQKNEYNKKLLHWQQYAEKDYVRNGTKWISRDDYILAKQESDTLVKRALKLVEVHNWKDAEKLFKNASKVDKNAIRSDFILALFYSPIFLNDSKKASRHYRTVLKRSPSHLSALNNIALAEIRLRNYSVALNYWKKAIQISPKIPEVTQNLGKLINEASQNNISVKSSVINKYSLLYSDAIVSGKGTKTDLSRGWQYMPLYLPRKEKERIVVVDDKITKLVTLGTGTGFVIAPNYIITNRHVVEDTTYGIDSVTIIDPKDPNHRKELNTTIIAISKNNDLAILHCKELSASPISLAVNLPRRGSDMMILGYPKTKFMGRSLKTTKGSITSLPTKEGVSTGMLMFDAEANGGNSGGPVCDKYGNCIGVLTAITTNLIGDYSLGIPSLSVKSFLSKNLPEIQLPKELNQELDWPDVDKKVSPSTVMILAHSKNSSLGVIPRKKQNKKKNNTFNFLEENICLCCNGTQLAKCPDCIKGKVKIGVQTQYEVGTGALKQTIKRTKRKTVHCKTCSGKGRIHCKKCP